MYAKSVQSPPRFDYPYQEQQRYSGAFVVSRGAERAEPLPQRTIQEITEAAQKLAPSSKSLAEVD